MGTNCAPLVADLFLFCYERDFMMSLSDEMQHYVFTVCQKLPFIQRVNSPLSDKFNQGIHRII